MFKKSASSRQKICFSPKQIIDDLERIQNNEERYKLYYCLDEKPPQENKLTNIREFLNGSHHLQETVYDLEKLVKELDDSSTELNSQIGVLSNKINKCVN